MPVSVVIVDYPGAMRSAIFGLADMLQLVDEVSTPGAGAPRFVVSVRRPEELKPSREWQVVILPPSTHGDYYLTPDSALVDWLKGQHVQGALLSSVCAGGFILAATGLLDGRRATTHWRLAGLFAERYSRVQVDEDQLLIAEPELITAGGLMAWSDLGLELVKRFCGSEDMRSLGKLLVLDTGAREQRYYKVFAPRLDHGDESIRRVQRTMQADLAKPHTVSILAQNACLSERTFLRRFVKATGHKPTEYLQRLRVQRACELLESSPRTVEAISYQVGYEDSSAFRKIFSRITGLTPREFRQRFAYSQ